MAEKERQRLAAEQKLAAEKLAQEKAKEAERKAKEDMDRVQAEAEAQLKS